MGPDSIWRTDGNRVVLVEEMAKAAEELIRNNEAGVEKLRNLSALLTGDKREELVARVAARNSFTERWDASLRRQVEFLRKAVALNPSKPDDRREMFRMYDNFFAEQVYIKAIEANKDEATAQGEKSAYLEKCSIRWNPKTPAK